MTPGADTKMRREAQEVSFESKRGLNGDILLPTSKPPTTLREGRVDADWWFNHGEVPSTTRRKLVGSAVLLFVTFVKTEVDSPVLYAGS